MRCNVSELERARRLPVYVDEDQWERAVKAAESELELLYSQGMIDVPTGPVNGTLHRVAVSIARRALLAATEPEGDVSDLPGVRIDEIGSHTATATDRPDGHGWRSGDGGW